ncbi:dynactin 6 [Sporothrix schenckii 1099-18]|uniref:Dynactin subunit 6 n=2 Tax=Sporothrix schenckii TaxID=29908 RepID=U7PKA4_SPOS1|nr:dynactin 6 [Sporothrix schenckii 1099-18]ERS95982.1 hypothetical protein HMPREF1624_07517 [Sporothrix schenckii ATCC 58251]KJR81763.1 dynactin 6 [Sporothrix schenckii 1099-18]
MSKRQSMMPAAPPTPVHFVTDRTGGGGGGPVVMADAVYVVGTFPVTISGDSVIHPRARLDAKGGPVNIGRRCIVEERAVVGGGAAFSASNSNVAVPGSFPSPEGSVTLGDYVSVETGSALEAGVVVGQGSVVGPRSQIGSGAVIGRYCTLAPRSRILPGERVPDFTVVYGQQRRRDGRVGAAEARHKQQARKIEVLRKLIPSVPEKYMAA